MWDKPPLPLYFSWQNKEKKPNPNTFSSIRFRLSLAHHEEFESPTFGSVDQRSIQLS